MGIFPDTDWNCIKELLKPVEQVLSYDLEKLRRTDRGSRTKMWNNIASNQQKFEENKCGDIERDIQEEISGKFSLAKLLLATAAYENKEDTPIINEFNDRELDLVKELERYVEFEKRKIDQIVGSIGRKEGGLYELITEYYEKGYNNLDNLWKDRSILTDLRIAFNNRYERIQKRIKEVTIACIDQYGLSWVKSSILAKVKESEQKREEIFRDAQQKIEELENKLKSYEPLEPENLSLKDKISELDVKLVRKEIESEAAQKILSTL
ncbi:MAG: hypothetical protein Q8N79_09330, partial [Candidatus Methanoperedens sp.]|nr:hypothetical protein [Candidatus Methanoperedens sp.]